MTDAAVCPAAPERGDLERLTDELARDDARPTPRGGRDDTPYARQPARAFWRSAVAEVAPLEMDGLYRPRFGITRETRIACAGSCFAQHIGHQLRARGYTFVDVEPAPPFLDPETARAHGYGRYSARHGNIYSARQLVQLFERAEGRFEPQDRVWFREGRAHDPFRPGIQPGGFATEDELLSDRAYHLERLRELLPRTDLFVFTFGLTEAWLNRADGAVLPACPGVHAGRFDPERYVFRNFRYSEVLADAQAFIRMARAQNPDMRFLFTVSPVPLTATATDAHVLTATTYSKSVLRAVCGELMEEHDFVDYFPSYELVAAPPMRGLFYRPDMREVAAPGVARVMDIFFAAHGDSAGMRAADPASLPAAADGAEVSCEEEILEFFAP